MVALTEDIIHRLNALNVKCILAKTYYGMRRSCWDMWHSTKRLEQREMEGRRSVSRGRSDRLYEESNCMGENATPESGRGGQKRLPDDSTRPHTRSVRRRLSLEHPYHGD